MEKKNPNFFKRLLNSLKGLFSKFRKKSKAPIGKSIVIPHPKENPRQKKARGSNNHNVSETKTRKLMAQESNRINRQRIKKWKY